MDDTLYPQKSFKQSGLRVVAGWVSEHFEFSRSLILAELESILKQKGASYPRMFDDLADRLKINNRAVSKMVQIFIDHTPDIKCYPGVRKMLGRLRSKFKLGLLTDGRLAVQQRKIRALELETEFDEILCSDMLGLVKPAFELFEWFENKFAIQGQNLVYVGDNPEKDFYGANLRSWTTVCVMTLENQNIDSESAFKPFIDVPSIIDLEYLLESNIKL